MNVPGHGLSVIVTINAPATAGISRFSMRGEGGATADEARLLVRDMIHIEPILPVLITLWRQDFKKDPLAAGRRFYPVNTFSL
ncbi:MAG: hypothetical protein AAAC47_23870 [Pararhizobium sp.]